MTQGTFTCPVDGAKLAPMERQGIEIDYCPSCRGVWLDRGELDKIIERSAAPVAVAAPAPAPPSGLDPYRQAPPQRYDDPYRPHGHKSHPHKRRKSFLEELFD
ncbi:TFIIB-type zinc ribbon-containing protein [Sphingomonas hengshuiensis]|uniref:Transcription factor zinc-finger domain-containing protein n=1 Tax=Sphingomonas hengshuiensis TaxID=1609977 RepID=A0A7U4J817_9SPHN|nr:zf-TFIIB domain-containing protein [Sphingomonas hengshuiensis]AJP71929.1 hypothetical protein TS85_09225 [Sphingomonas hengshuiensis]